MSTRSPRSPIVHDGVVSDERLVELLALQTEYADLDYKRVVDLANTGATIEFAKDVGAMQVLGGYVVIGVDDHGNPTGEMDAVNVRAFDEASLRQKILRYLPEPLRLATRVTDQGGHHVVLVYVGAHEDGCAFFKIDGAYERDGRQKVAFRQGDVFWRDGTSSTRMSQAGHRAVVAARVAAAKEEWFTEQRELRRQEQAELQAAYDSRSAAQGPLGTVNFDLPPHELNLAALELVRAGDDIALRHLISAATARARQFVDAGQLDEELGALLDSLICLAATFLEYGQAAWFDRVVEALRTIYSLPLREGDAQRFGYSSRISPDELAPRLWLQLMPRIFALGGLAVRLRDWAAVRTLSLQLPERLMHYETNWLRHSVTMMSRATHLQEQQSNTVVEVSLLNLARTHVGRLDCLRPDGLDAEDDDLLTSLAQFDVLSNLVAVADRPDLHFGKTFYPNFARFRQDRVQGVVDALLRDASMRTGLGVEDDAVLAFALDAVGTIAATDGARFPGGFHDWTSGPVGDFIQANLPAEPSV